MKLKSLFILVLVFLTACQSGEEKKGGEQSTTKKKTIVRKAETEIMDVGATAKMTGKPGRLMIVSDNTVFVEEIEELFDKTFDTPIRPYYPRTPYFEVFQRSPKEFRRLSTRLRNVIEIELSDNIEKGKPKMYIYKNYYAKGQLYTKFVANDITDLYNHIKKYADYLFEIYNEQEWKREYVIHRSKKNTEVSKILEKKFGIDLTFPRNVALESIDDTYAIIRFPSRTKQMEMMAGGRTHGNETNVISAGIMVWQYPYSDKEQLETSELLRMRDTILKKYAKYEVDGVYMGTQYHLAAFPEVKPFRVNGINGYKTRGLFKFTGKYEPSGGRFIEFSFKHPNRDTIVVVSGYIDAPPTERVIQDYNRIRSVIYSLGVK